MHIDNLYRCQDVLMFKEVWALEKIHGTSAHISWNDGQVRFFAGGESHVNFVKLFDEETLIAKFQEMGHEKIIIFGEAYGGKQQGQSYRYGKVLKFVAFDVKIGDYWLDVPNAHKVAETLGLEFVYYKRVPAEVSDLDVERDAPSEQAKRNGIEEDQPREGIVIRPIRELSSNNGSRIVAKHKRAEERETKTQRTVSDPAKLAVLEEADAIADEWVTPTRLEHVLDKLLADIGGQVDMSWTPEVIKRMVEDVTREAQGEIIDSKDARKSIGSRAAKLFKKHLQDKLKNT